MVYISLNKISYVLVYNFIFIFHNKYVLNSIVTFFGQSGGHFEFSLIQTNRDGGHLGSISNIVLDIKHYLCTKFHASTPFCTIPLILCA